MAERSDIVQRIATKAVIVNADGEVLILREAQTYTDGTNIGRYHMPGGRIDPGEPFEDGLRREVIEETGLEIEIGKPLYVGEWYPVIHGVKHHIVAIFFTCTPKSEKITLSEEHDDYKWINPEDAGQYDLMTPEDKVVEAYKKAAH